MLDQLALADGSKAARDRGDHRLRIDVADDGDLDRVGGDDRSKRSAGFLEVALLEHCARRHSEPLVAVGEHDRKAKRCNRGRLGVDLFLDDRDGVAPFALGFGTETGVEKVGGADLHLQSEVLGRGRPGGDEGVVGDSGPEHQHLAGAELLQLLERLFLQRGERGDGAEHHVHPGLVLGQVEDSVAEPDEEADLSGFEIGLLDVELHVVGEADGLDAEVGNRLVLDDLTRGAEAVVGELSRSGVGGRRQRDRPALVEDTRDFRGWNRRLRAQVNKRGASGPKCFQGRADFGGRDRLRDFLEQRIAVLRRGHELVLADHVQDCGREALVVARVLLLCRGPKRRAGGGELGLQFACGDSVLHRPAHLLLGRIDGILPGAVLGGDLQGRDLRGVFLLLDQHSAAEQ